MEHVTEFKNTQNAESINQALQLLYKENLITEEDIHDIAEKNRVRTRPSSTGVGARFNEVIGSIQKASLESIGKAKEKVVETTQQTVKQVDQSAHQSPWIFIGVASGLSAIAGYFLGQKFKH